MKKIMLSSLVILGLAAVTYGSTRAVFSSQAVLGDNTFATGILEIRLNGQQTLPGFSITDAAPGSEVEKHFTLQNYGAPWFGGPSNLSAVELVATPNKVSGSSMLYNVLEAKLYANAGWSGCSNAGVHFEPGYGCEVYNGLLKDMNEADILNATQWGTHPVLIPGNSFSMTLVVKLPDATGDDVQGKSTTFDLLVDAYNPHR